MTDQFNKVMEETERIFGYPRARILSKKNTEGAKIAAMTLLAQFNPDVRRKVPLLFGNSPCVMVYAEKTHRDMYATYPRYAERFDRLREACYPNKKVPRQVPIVNSIVIHHHGNEIKITKSFIYVNGELIHKL